MSMSRRTAKDILDAVGEPHLDLQRGQGYWYFVYDDGAETFETHSVFTPRLSDGSLDMWIREARTFLEGLQNSIQEDEPYEV